MLVHKFNFPTLWTQAAGPADVLCFLKNTKLGINKNAGVK